MDMNDGSLTLAITTIGDLLLRQRISNRGNNQPIHDVDLRIPDYQRPYKWKTKNAVQLLDDIEDAFNQDKERYRVGTLILHKKKNEQGNIQYDIVDGQQRTITFALLLHILHNIAPAEEKTAIELLNQDISANSNTIINLSQNLQAFGRRLNLNLDDKNAMSQHIGRMARLRKYIEDNCELIVVITESQSEAFQFFDSQNARGKALFPHDLLKAYHLREVADEDESHIEKIVGSWENISQIDLNELFSEYLYRIREWMKGNEALSLNEENIHKFKGVTKQSRTPFSQFYKSAYSYADMINSSSMPFVSGSREVAAFQLNAPIIAGEPFFKFTTHYFTLLKDIQDNNRYRGFYIKDNIIVRTLTRYFNRGTGNLITRLIFNSALLLYIDRFCPPRYPTKQETELFEQFVINAFIWAYSLRAQYYGLGWLSAQNFILGRGTKKLKNSFNLFKLISEVDTPEALCRALSDLLQPLKESEIKHAAVIPNQGRNGEIDELDNSDVNQAVYKNYLHFFKTNLYLQ